MKQALLDFLDRALLVALFAGGYGLSLVCSGFGGFALLFALGIIHPAAPPANWVEYAWVPWILALCMLSLAPLAFLFSRRVVPPIAAQDPRTRPALYAAVCFFASGVATCAAWKGFLLLAEGLGLRREHEFDVMLTCYALGLIFLSWLGFHGQRHLREHWPYARRDESRDVPSRPKLLLPPDYRA